MAHGHEHYALEGAGDPGAAHSALHADHGPRVLPADLSAPPAVAAWKTRSLIVAVVGLVLSGILGVLDFNHVARAYLQAWMLVFGLCGGGLCVLMLQYISGGKWGLVLRRPLEAMAATWWVVAALCLPFFVFGKRLWLWAAYPTHEAVENALHSGLLTEGQAHSLDWKRIMLSPASVTIQIAIVLGFIAVWTTFLNRWSLQRDADPERGTQASYEYWRTKTENLSGIGILLYSGLLTLVAIDFVMALDITWYSTMYGLIFLVGQGYAVLALGVNTTIRLSLYEPLKTILRKTEQYDLGKFMLAFVMLNIYLSFAQFLIIWSANSPEEIPWYLNRIGGGWWVFTSLDFIFHWVVPFCCLLSRSFKYDNRKMLGLTMWMMFARCFDLFWLIEPNFPDAARNFHLSAGIFAYITVPVAIGGIWLYFYFTNLASRPLLALNDPHTAEVLEPEHAH
ncbi:hypothetical protein [Terriglobus roseus]|uniref:Quinol:cytochrome c oxidoreductase quinone-binding subunit 2 n=1 Tax=Terriglobus roseus TaxID=392734 RepID=A0A1G7NAC1_9BACT|nr:hypothetical protein [Terriglobus roseus]SDF71008.1 quinol:cytochrome c oxidoreductase quinone-binding subunit 2 [Terriglobus roseus]